MWLMAVAESSDSTVNSVIDCHAMCRLPLLCVCDYAHATISLFRWYAFLMLFTVFTMETLLSIDTKSLDVACTGLPQHSGLTTTVRSVLSA